MTIDWNAVQTAEGKAQAALAAHQVAVKAAIDAHVEAQAKALHYNSAAHLASYVASTKREWAAEATLFVAWRDQVWTAALEALADAQETGAVPTCDDVIAALPKWLWE